MRNHKKVLRSLIQSLSVNLFIIFDRCTSPSSNLTNVNGPVIECHDTRLIGQIRQLIRWALR